LTAACDAFPRLDRSEEADPRLTLSLDMSDVLDWGDVSNIQLTLTNQGDAPSPKAHVELYLPAWLEFSSVEPERTEVSLLRSGAETRLMYRLGDPALQPGESRTVIQRVRVPPQTGTAGTLAGGLRQAPADRVLRARLVSPEGEEFGAEVRTVMPFRGAVDTAAVQPGGAETMSGAEPRIESDRVGAIRLGASLAELRAAVPTSRDTTFTYGEGEQGRGLAVPLAGGGVALALVVDDRVDRIIVRDARLRTARGLGVGSTIQQLRQVYGRSCFAPAAGGGTAVWFPSLPGISFAFDGRPSLSKDTAVARAALPDASQVRELWVRRGVDTC
jgi:hypothetical protein